MTNRLNSGIILDEIDTTCFSSILSKEVFAMEKRKIKLSATEDVREFVAAAEICDFDVDIFYNRFVVDAKSILGVLSMDLTKELTVRYGGNDLRFENILDKYSIA